MIRFLQITLILILSCTVVATNAQGNEITLKELKNYSNSELESSYEEFKIFETDFKQLKMHLASNDFAKIILDNDQWKNAQIEWVPSLVYQEGIIIDEFRQSGRERVSDVRLPQTYKAYTPFGDARLTINDEYLNGFIDGVDGTYYLQQIENDLGKDLIVLYKDSETKEAQLGTCGGDNHDTKDMIQPEKLKSVGQCYQLDLAIAADFLMYQERGSAQALVNHILANINNVAPNYELNGSVNFPDGIEFNVTEIVLSSCSDCDPWTDETNVFQVLFNFKVWASDGGFLSNHKMGQYWTDRDFDGAYVGLADNATNLFCSLKAYHVLQDYTSNMNFLRILTSHEMGHNFGGIHVNSTGFIMSAVLNNTNDWHSSNQSIIGGEIANEGPMCLNACGANPCSFVTDFEVSNVGNTSFDLDWTGNPGESFDVEVMNRKNSQIIYSTTTTSNSLTVSPSDYEICNQYLVSIIRNCGSGSSPKNSIIFSSPVIQGCADFCPDKRVNWTSGAIQFNDESINATSWNWNFGDGNTSNSQNPAHVYNMPGFYMVSLAVNGGAHMMQEDSLIAVLPNRTLPYSLLDGGSFDTANDDFATEGLNGTESIWEKGIASGPLNSTDNVWKTKLSEDVGPGARESVLYTPRFDFSNTGNYVLEFDLAMETVFCNGPYAIQVQYSTDNGSNWTRLGSYGDTGPNTMGWYNRGPGSSCPISNLVFSDQTGWTFTGSMLSTYDVSFLSGNSQVLFRFAFNSFAGFTLGYDADGVMINDFRITASGVLALDLNSFSGLTKEGYNELTWEAQNLVDFDAFDIERSLDGVQFFTIGEIKGETDKIMYGFEDHNIPDQTYYYRLRMKDLDGSFEFSNIIKLSNKNSPKLISLYPNPVRGELIYIDTNQAIEEVQFINAVGKVVKKAPFANSVDISQIRSGTYIVQLISNGQTIHTQKLIIL